MQYTSTADLAGFKLTGRRISSGLGIGSAYVIRDIFEDSTQARRIESGEVDHELERIRSAFDQTRTDLKESARRVEEQFSADLAGIFRAHEMMLDGLFSSPEFVQEMQASLVTSEVVVRRVFRRWHQKFQNLGSIPFQQRADDLADVGRRVLRYLTGKDAHPWKDLPAGSVLVVRRLLPSDVVSLSRSKVNAIVVESLGHGSHAALLVREKSIPTVADFPGIFDRIVAGTEVLVDAYRGEITTQPEPAVRKEFLDRLESYRATLVRCRSTCRTPARTLDGTLVTVEANLGTQDDAELALGNGADGIGLFRIEQLYLASELPPSESELVDALRAATAPLRDKPLTIRLLDIGGDKPVPFLRFPEEANPALGQRGVRLLLAYPQLLRTQLAALLRLSQEQTIRILVPMVTLEEDMRAVRALFETACVDSGINTRPALGAMIETPAAALGVPAIARHADFLCVGTNDLTQYTLAAGRDDPSVNAYFLDDHASLLRLLSIVVADSGATPLTVCGELAGREEMIPQLLAMGFRSLSVAPPAIPDAKDRIRSLRIAPQTPRN